MHKRQGRNLSCLSRPRQRDLDVTQIGGKEKQKRTSQPGDNGRKRERERERVSERERKSE